MKKPQDRLVSLIPPAVPIWGVSYAEGEPNDLLFWSVMCLGIVEEKNSDPSSRIIRSLCFDRENGVDPMWWDVRDEILGYLLEEELPKAAEIFAADIARERNKVKK